MRNSTARHSKFFDHRDGEGGDQAGYEPRQTGPRRESRDAGGPEGQVDRRHQPDADQQPERQRKGGGARIDLARPPTLQRTDQRIDAEKERRFEQIAQRRQRHVQR
jgi:hypothetical protein